VSGAGQAAARPAGLVTLLFKDSRAAPDRGQRPRASTVGSRLGVSNNEPIPLCYLKVELVPTRELLDLLTNSGHL
jgi:hypothetical protein